MVVNPETGDTRSVTQCTGLCLQDTEPAFSPDGDSLSFHRYRGPVETVMAVNDEIWSVGIDGSDPHQVTNVDSKPPDAIEEQGSAFSPNGKMLAFDRVRKEGSRYLSHAVFVQLIGSPEDAHQLTPWEMNCQDHPEFSPDGKLLLFRCLPEGEEGSSNLYLVHPDGTGLHQLTDAPANKQYLDSSFSEAEGWITVGRTAGYGGDGNEVVGVFNDPAFRDVVTCGRGFDRVFADKKDTIARDCERMADSGPEYVRLGESIPESFWEGLHPQF